ncbi:MAG TPA: hypothetical protein VGR28_10115 [Candidatus Thermoplasmatota archaeon]|jgi:hypothetical protein|nr:hypothetical protein [Candidatus Thermoplasmatota archaeon]
MLRELVAVMLVLGWTATLGGAVGEEAAIFTGPVVVATNDGAVPCTAATTTTVRVEPAQDSVTLTAWNPCAPTFYSDGTPLVPVALLHYVAHWSLARDCATDASGALACTLACDALSLAPDGTLHYRFTQVSGRHWDLTGQLLPLA